jgi:UDP-2,3-diacylglucosamine hydrolase
MLERFGERPGPVVFLSDAHLGASIGTAERAAWLVEFLETLPGRIGGLLVVGDLFDFWFEYRHAIPKGHFRVCEALHRIARTGVPCLYFGGNHDFWAGSFLEKEVGLWVTQTAHSFEIQGRRVFVAHGDGLGTGDLGYRIIKKILRNRVCITLYRSIHPDIGIPFAYLFSVLSRRHTKPREVLIPLLVRDIAGPHLTEGHDSVVIGHIHEPTHIRLAKGEFLILGDWIESMTYAVLEDGRFRLCRFRPGTDPEVVAVEDRRS